MWDDAEMVTSEMVQDYCTLISMKLWFDLPNNTTVCFCLNFPFVVVPLTYKDWQPD